MTTLGEKLREAIEKKSVIQTTINAWDAHEDEIRKPQQEKQMTTQEVQHFAITNNVMRATFDAVKNAPKMKHAEYVEMLKLNGYKESSTNSVLYQLRRSGQVKRDEHGQLSVTQDEYEPIKQPKKVREPAPAPEQTRRRIVLVKRRKDDPSQGIAALTPDTGGPGLPNVEKFDMGSFKHHAVRAFHPSAIVDGLTVLHARELYDYLKKIFGGN